jgi:hypothetical protein
MEMETAYQELVKIFALVDPHLGTVADREVSGKLRSSRYSDSNVDDHLYFDVGNNFVSASVSPRGAIHRAMIFTGLSSEVTDLTMYPGVWCDYHFLNFCEDTSFIVETEGTCTELAQPGLGQDMSLIDGFFPLVSTQIGKLKIRQIVMAPIYEGKRMRDLFIGFLIETEADTPQAATLQIPKPRKGIEQRQCLDGDGDGWVKRCMGRGEFILLDGLEKTSPSNDYHFSVTRTQPAWIPMLLVMGEDTNDFLLKLQDVKKVPSLPLIAETRDFFSRQTCRFEIPGSKDPLCSIFPKSIHAQVTSQLCDRAGNPLGSSFGTDVSEAITEGQLGHIWLMCAFYNYLSAGIICPDQLADGVRFFMTRGNPAHVHDTKRIADMYETDEIINQLYGIGDRLTKFPQYVLDKAFEERRKSESKLRDFPGIRYSLSSEVSSIVLAGVYYSLTGDGETLKQMVERDPVTGQKLSLETIITQLSDSLLSAKPPNTPMLFETIWISDGPARGKYHTGSNILAWYAFQAAARILDDVFGDSKKAKELADVAGQMKKDIRDYCTVEHMGKKMFTEGYDTELLHDGEESITTILPFLGFCCADDAEVLNFKKFACSPDNPLWDPITEGIFFGGRRITMPGFNSELAAASSEKELSQVLEKLCSFVDADGQWWWWPMDKGQTDVRRGSAGKCGWGQGLFVIQFLTTVLGIKWDAPTGNLTIKPFVPWDHFKAENIIFGSLSLDLEYHNSDQGTKITLIHNQSNLKKLDIIVRVPCETTDCEVNSSSSACSLHREMPYFDKDTWRLSIKDTSQQKVSIDLSW